MLLLDLPGLKNLAGLFLSNVRFDPTNTNITLITFP